jgi:hypothetical protein
MTSQRSTLALWWAKRWLTQLSEPCIGECLINTMLARSNRDYEGHLWAVTVTLSRCIDANRTTSYHEESPAFKNEDVDMTATTKTAKALTRQSNVWRSIILSTQGETYKPYCVYVRVLDFRNLTNMLEDFKFGVEMRSKFFAGAMERFHKPESKRLTKARKFPYLNIPPIIDAIGTEITKQSPYLQELDGQLNHDLLPSWISNTPHLKSMTLYRGDALSEDAGIAVRYVLE